MAVLLPIRYLPPAVPEPVFLDLMDRRRIIGGVIGLAVSPLPLYFALNSMDSGYGDYRGAFTFFPVVRFSSCLRAEVIALPLALVQYPFYGWFAGRCISNKPFARFSVVLLLLHVIPMLWTFL